MRYNIIAFLAAALACVALADRTATQGYVQRATNDVLAAATNYVDAIRRDIENDIPSGAPAPLPRYLHALDFADSYPDAATEYYASSGGGEAGGCSAVRSGGFLCRNFDFPFDNRAEFVVRMSAGTGRFASIGIAQVGTNLTEAVVTSGRPSRFYKALPGATVDGINENGVVAEINVVDGAPPASAGGDIHPLGAVRWALDNGTSAHMAATNLAARIAFPSGWTQNFHWMVADEHETWIVENGVASNVTAVAEKLVMTNFQILPDGYVGTGVERYRLLLGGANITNAWYTNAYRRETNPPWTSDLADVLDYTNAIFNAWASNPREHFRGRTNGGEPWWQTVHTSVYDISNRTLRVAVQETDDWHMFQVPASGGGADEGAVRAIVGAFAETGAVFRASSVGDAETWTDATGCVWHVELGSSFAVTVTPRPPYDVTVAWHDPYGYQEAWYYMANGSPNFVSSDFGLDYFTDEWTEQTWYDPNGGGSIYTTYRLAAFRDKVTNLVGRVALTNDIPRTASDVGAQPALPYPTNAIPVSAIDGGISFITDGTNSIHADGTVTNIVEVPGSWDFVVDDDPPVRLDPDADAPMHWYDHEATSGPREALWFDGEGGKWIYGKKEQNRYSLDQFVEGSATDTQVAMVWQGLQLSFERSGQGQVTNVTRVALTNDIAAIPTTYAATNAVVALNQSVQYAAVASGASLTILAPSAVSGGVRDWVVYANCAADGTRLILPNANIYAADEAYTNDLKSGVTVLYFTEIPDAGYHLSRVELKALGGAQ